MKTRLLALAALAAVLVVPSADARSRGPGMMMRPSANPSALIATEIAFARLAQEKGQWTAFAETAAEGAEMFVPRRVPAAEWLKKRANPAHAVAWQAHAAWVSCDGATGVTRGAWQDGGDGAGRTGWFATVWQRQAKGGFKWLLDQGDDVATPIPAPDFLEGKVADCPARPGMEDDSLQSSDQRRSDARKADAPPPPRPLAGPIPPADATVGGDSKDGRSADGTLAWRSTVLSDGARDFTVWLWKDGAMAEVLKLHANAAKGG